jgi:pimeloyl-ACP methyl ester carboxylesterase
VWSPAAFATYAERYPDTPALPTVVSLGTAFVEAWSGADLDARVVAATRGLHVVFVRGFLGNWMPGNLAAPVRALRALGVHATLARTDSGAPVSANVAALAAQVPAGPLLLCGHSKGGLECLRLADTRPLDVRGVRLSQTPRGPSAVLESLLLRRHQESLARPHRRAAEALQRAGLHAIGATPGGTELTREPLATVIAAVDAAPPRPFPVWQTASWSSRPTAWLDSFHERLGEIRPRCAHDGQFYVEDLVWPGLPHLLLPHLDHAQPAMGGFGFDHVRYWKALISLIAAA